MADDQPTVEQWRPIPSSPGYEASDHGNIRSVDRTITDALGRVRRLKGQTLRPGPHPTGHLTVAIGRKSRWVHQLVLEAFVGPRPDGMVTCHWNDNPADNRLSNLRWDYQSANSQDMIRNGAHLPSNKTHCENGHLLPDAVDVGGRSRRMCPVCTRERKREYSERRAAKYGPNNPPPPPPEHCKHGHPMSGENLRLTRGVWVCRTCNIERGRKHYRKNIGLAP